MEMFRGDASMAQLGAFPDLDQAFGRPLGQGSPRLAAWLPSADVYETDDEIVIALDVPGCHPENLRAEVVENQLVIAGERTQANDAVRRFTNERWSGTFARSFALPRNLRTDEVAAEYTDGVLTLRVPKPDETRPKRIPINDPRQLTEST
jgi:HSP20 family protein